ncbi:MAG: 50S ribosomal protein L3 N(5)-glutamine methyltransferase [Xanthomonadales bacterium]|jgi:ribosomal protein L3 glutamine methyltransferase|nr:50S ribosomal protein L3 N(5)-glutamine methyltransferase [Xanthomonadales bacterium]
MTENLTLANWTDRVTAQFATAGLHYGHGTDNAQDEAAWLVLHAAGAALDGRFEDWGRVADEATARKIEELSRLRCETGKPLAYLTGTAFFAGLAFEVNEDVLVPRSPLAELIPDGFRPWVKPGQIEWVLDMCTGSGCIGIAAAVHTPGLRVDLADISPAALDVARRNVQRHAVADRVALFESDLFAALPPRAYDLVLANPPYVPAASIAALPREYREEPEIGLVSGNDGLDAPLAILLDAPRFLCEYGVLVCEVGESEDRLATLLPGVPFTWLEFQHGGSGVFVLTREELLEAAPRVEAAMDKRNDVT